MILIISKDNEITTTEVIKWLVYYNKDFIRVNEDELFEIKMTSGKLKLESNKSNFFLDEITSVWYRRGAIKFKRIEYDNKAVNIHMNETQHWLEEYVLNILETKKHINKQTKSHVNKLLILETAKKIGLDVPDFFLANSTKNVKLGKTIVKPITGNPILQSFKKNMDATMFTAVVEEHCDEDFFISFFQEKIEKDFEIRCFYLNGKIWSFAIISQNDEQTKVDFRKYNIQVPNRNVRYQLPRSVEENIHILMKTIDLNCGSIDIIKSKEKFYFLEVNVVGQFLSLSDTCNYSLDKEFAKYL
ncbi:grasp-with-spasm system ATP-grasp peptide maturase [Epilithonimonas vandammei]|uniref:Grasp-with-spasm system ATP-grasp peptide maturase n=1 Tax=Epilithonimonas vandammei TaxID=2487072 RepID=A0A3G8ZDH4_9FLAO|nr:MULTISPECIES: grasp-with-spasm system ATP-grasp peptide maturase [Epilithonimonas]AZI55203.1 grasp-with-spasm system ATP-grasp peptide maturase [Epilithonimonas vandammei]